MPKYKAPEGVIGINIGGQQFNADEKGIISIPDDGSYTLPEGYTQVADVVPAVTENTARSATSYAHTEE